MFTLSFIIILLSGCSVAKIDASNPYIHQYELVEKHKYNKNITVFIPTPNCYYEMSFPYFGEIFIRKLNIDAYIKKIVVKDIEKRINSKIDSFREYMEEVWARKFILD